jgi:hypothetical protein
MDYTSQDGLHISGWVTHLRMDYTHLTRPHVATTPGRQLSHTGSALQKEEAGPHLHVGICEDSPHLWLVCCPPVLDMWGRLMLQVVVHLGAHKGGHRT